MLKIVSAAMVLSALLAGPALAREPGSGLYARDCQDPEAGYDITVTDDGSANVRHDGKAYDNVLTSYSFFGNETPADFLIAILFDEDNSPVPPLDGQPGWIEIWQGEAAFYALENGVKDEKLLFCQ